MSKTDLALLSAAVWAAGSALPSPSILVRCCRWRLASGA